MKLTSLPPGMRTFATVWFGQLVSMIGTGMTQFALSVWVLQQTGNATAYGIVLFFGMLPGILFSLVSGVVADRWDRRRTMIAADTVAALGTLSVALLYWADRLEVWHICAAVAISATAQAFQGPAWGSMLALLVPEQHLGRASGMNSMARSAQQITGPLLGGVLVLTLGLGAVFLIDFITFFAALGCLAAVKFPAVPRTEAARQAAGSILREAKYGWQYVWQFPALRAHLTYFAGVNFILSFVWVLFPPLVLSFSNAAGMGTVAAAYGVGMLAGGMVMTAWGGPQRRVLGMLGGGVGAGVGMMGMGLLPNVGTIAFMLALLCFGLPILNGCFARIWLPRIAPDVQGRAVAAIQVTSWSTQPIAYLAAGPIADRVFRPLLMEGGPLANSIGQVIGTGPGRGIGLMLILGGILLMAVTAVFALVPSFYGAEENVPIVAKPADAAPPAVEPEPEPVAEGPAPVPA
ncbi:MAG TPA: MFS transporter [Longimicrobium sp.]|nr:MFS transporter [Longimicrobium sp.]